jgi:hypothetical protein
MEISFGNKKNKTIVKEIIAFVSKHKVIFVILAAGTVAAAFFWSFNRANPSEAQENLAQWKNFSESNYGFSFDYPAGWSLDISYDRYGASLMSADLSNKKCGFNPKQCAADCLDARILVGKKTSGNEVTPLFVQLYEDFMMVRDFSDASSMVSSINLGSKKVYKVANNSPTAALTGACAGPLYVFETETSFAYVFAGYGSNSVGATSTVEKIIASINIR